MIKAIDSDDAMDYLRVRKQAGESKINIKKAKVFDRGAQGVNQDQDDDEREQANNEDDGEAMVEMGDDGLEDPLQANSTAVT